MDTTQAIDWDLEDIVDDEQEGDVQVNYLPSVISELGRLATAKSCFLMMVQCQVLTDYHNAYLVHETTCMPMQRHTDLGGTSVALAPSRSCLDQVVPLGCRLGASVSRTPMGNQSCISFIQVRILPCIQ